MADPLAEALLATDSRKPEKRRIIRLFGDRPEVLEAIKTMRQRGHSYRVIADVLTKNGDESVSPNAVQRFLDDEGVE